jgi:hypothetical protein
MKGEYAMGQLFKFSPKNDRRHVNSPAAWECQGKSRSFDVSRETSKGQPPILSMFHVKQPHLVSLVVSYVSRET